MEIAVRESNDLIRNIDDVARLAKMFAESGSFPDIRNVNAAGVKIVAGHALGISPFAAVANIHVFQGKVEIGSRLMAALVKQSGRYNYRVLESTATKCVIEWFEQGVSIGTSEFTAEEAKAAGLAGKDNWKNYASDMLFARALSRGARRFAPDVILGAYVRGEVSVPAATAVDNGEDPVVDFVDATEAVEIPEGEV